VFNDFDETPFGDLLTGPTEYVGPSTLITYAGMEHDDETGLYYDHERYYSSATATWESQDPLTFSSGDTNFYRYVGNNVTDATDPSGLADGAANGAGAALANPPNPPAPPAAPPAAHPVAPLSGLKNALIGISKTCPAKKEAVRIGQAIENTFNYHWNWPSSGSLAPLWGGTNDKVKGYYCYEWAYAFQDAFGYESSGTYFKARVEGVSKPDPNDPDNAFIHAWLSITSLETGKSVFVDDGFMYAGAYVHTTPPTGGWPGTFMPGDRPRSQCHVPTAYDAEGSDRIFPPGHLPDFGDGTLPSTTW
jgi:RHS repeat-associated protein